MSCEKCEEFEQEIETLKQNIEDLEDELGEAESQVNDLEAEIGERESEYERLYDYADFDFEAFAKWCFEEGAKTGGSLKEWLNFRLQVRSKTP